MKNKFFPFALAKNPSIIATDNINDVVPTDYEGDNFSIIVAFKDKRDDLDFEYQSAELRDRDFQNICNLILGRNETQNRNIV